MTISAVTYKCDRDGTEAPGVPPNILLLPVGWTSMNFAGQNMMPASGHLCPACTEAVSRELKASGGTFALEPGPALPPPA